MLVWRAFIGSCVMGALSSACGNGDESALLASRQVALTRPAEAAEPHEDAAAADGSRPDMAVDRPPEWLDSRPPTVEELAQNQAVLRESAEEGQRLARLVHHDVVDDLTSRATEDLSRARSIEGRVAMRQQSLLAGYDHIVSVGAAWSLDELRATTSAFRDAMHTPDSDRETLAWRNLQVDLAQLRHPELTDEQRAEAARMRPAMEASLETFRRRLERENPPQPYSMDPPPPSTEATRRQAQQELEQAVRATETTTSEVRDAQ